MVKTTKGNEEPQESALLTPPRPGEEFFGGEGKSYEVTRDVHPLQLIDEVYDRLGDRSKYEVVAHLEDDDSPVSESNPLTLHLTGNVDLRTVRAVVETHEKNPDYGLDSEEIQINGLKERLLSGEDLPASDLNVLLRSIFQK